MRLLVLANETRLHHRTRDGGVSRMKSNFSASTNPRRQETCRMTSDQTPHRDYSSALAGQARRRTGVVAAARDVAPLAPHEVTVRMAAAPINPSDMGLLFGPADISAFRLSGTADKPVATAPIPEAAMTGLAGRLNVALPVGNEGAGVVVAAGTSAEAQALLGKTVGLRGGAMYAQYRNVAADQCLALPEGTTAAEAASSFVNPLTALGMVETMRARGSPRAGAHGGGVQPGPDAQPDLPAGWHRAGEHRAQARTGRAARVDGRSARVRHQLAHLFPGPHRRAGGNGRNDRLRCHRRRHAGRPDPRLHGSGAEQDAKAFSRYGSTTHKQVYIYGGLDTRPTTLGPQFWPGLGHGRLVADPVPAAHRR